MSPVGTDVEKDVRVHKRKIQAVGQVRHLLHVSSQLYLFPEKIRASAVLMYLDIVMHQIHEKQTGQC
jgi:hypothetical protein